MQRLMGEQSQLDAARHIGISKSNITRWKNGARAAPDFVVKVARAYNTNVLEALVEAEFITGKEAKLRRITPNVTSALRIATDEQLTDEVLRRLDLGSTSSSTATSGEIDRRPNTAGADALPVRDNEDPTAGVNLSSDAAHPKAPPREKENPTP